LDNKAIEFREKKYNKGYYAAQGRSSSLRWVSKARMRLPISD